MKLHIHLEDLDVTLNDAAQATDSLHVVEGDPELQRLLDEVQRRELDPLTAVQEIMEKVFKLGDGDGTHTR